MLEVCAVQHAYVLDFKNNEVARYSNRISARFSRYSKIYLFAFGHLALCKIVMVSSSLQNNNNNLDQPVSCRHSMNKAWNRFKKVLWFCPPPVLCLKFQRFLNLVLPVDRVTLSTRVVCRNYPFDILYIG